MLINSPDSSDCLFSWYWLLIMVGGVACVGGDFSQTYTVTHNPAELWTALHTHNTVPEQPEQYLPIPPKQIYSLW